MPVRAAANRLLESFQQRVELRMMMSADFNRAAERVFGVYVVAVDRADARRRGVTE